MRIISLAPAATEIVYALGLGDELVGRTHRCDHPAEVADVPVVTVEDVNAPERSVDATLIARLEPDLVLADGSEDQPLVDYGEISRVVGAMSRETTLVALAPYTIEGILNSISTIGAYTEAEYEAVGLVEMMRERLYAVDTEPLQRGRRDQRRVVVLEELDPLRAAGRWVPEMVRLAGGWEILGRSGQPSVVTSWDLLREVEPQMIVLALRDADARGATSAYAQASLPPWFDQLKAVREGELFAVDGRGLFSRPGPRVVDGIAVLAELLEPEAYAGSSPLESWLPLAPIGLAGRSSSDRPAG